MKEKNNLYQIIGLILLVAISCVQPIEFDVPSPGSLLVIEGMISDSDGPYVVQITTAIQLDADSIMRPPVEKAHVRLFDDQNNVEDFEEISPGLYQTGGAMKGQIGRSYHIRVETAEGKVFESAPDMIKPVGEINEIRYEYEKRVDEEFFADINKDVFNIYVDSNAGPGEDNFVRWRMIGTYRIDTNPELHMSFVINYTPWKSPRPCSGYVLLGSPPPGGRLEKVGECTCCECWVNQYEKAPQISDDLLIEDKQFNNVKVGEVPITTQTFHDKYMVEVEQMSLTQTAFDFFNLVKIQKTEASSIFQPPSGEIIGNIKPVNSDDAVVGLFWATATSKKHIFIQREDVPYPIAPYSTIAESCLLTFKNSSTDKPEEWN